MIGDNIKNVRTTLKLTQQAFAERINLKQGTIASIESNKRNISRQAILVICREFGVNENYLLTGEGEMFIARDDSSLGQLIKDYDLGAGDVAAIKLSAGGKTLLKKRRRSWGLSTKGAKYFLKSLP